MYLNSPQKNSFERVKDTLKAFIDLKNKQKIVWSNVFWCVKVFIFWKCIHYTIHEDKIQRLKKFRSDKINGTENVPTYQSFTCNLWFLYELRHKARLSETLCEIFHFWFCFIFIKFMFLFNKMHDFKTTQFLSKLT